MDKDIDMFGSKAPERQRTVLVTGGSGGIGKAIVRHFAQMGDRVVLHYNTQSETALGIENALVSKGLSVKALKADLTKSEAVHQLFSEIESCYGPVEVLINAAGYSDQDLCQDITDDAWKKMMSINLDATFYTCRRAIPQMIEAHKGVILNISSIWGMTGASMEVHYSAAKAGVIGLTKALSKELGPSQIRVNCLAPGWIDTEMNADHDQETQEAFLMETPLGRMGSPKEMAEWSWFLCSAEASFMTGQIISPNGGVVI